MQRILSVCTCSVALLTAASAQTAPAPAADEPKSAKSIEVPVELSPFVVSSDQDVGYLAGNTLAGSRLNTALKDTAASISIFTPEFIKDVGAFTLAEVMAYAGNTAYDRDEE